MNEEDRELTELFQSYSLACEIGDVGADFMPRLWSRIEGKRTFSWVFGRWARMLVTASAAACLVVGVLNLLPATSGSALKSGYASYIDALSADTTVERTYHSESVRPADMFPTDLRE